MISIDLFAHLAVVAIYLLFWVFGFILFYHLTRFGVGLHPKRLAAIFFIGSIVLFLVSVITFTKIDFSTLGTLI